MPVSETDWVVAGAATLTVNVAVFGFGVPLVGVNDTFTVQLLPDANVAPQVVVRENWFALVPPNAMLLIVKVPVPVLLTVTCCGAPKKPSGWLNDRDVVDRERTGPVPALTVSVPLTNVKL